MGTCSVVYETFLAVQWLRFCLANAGVVNSIPGWGTKILHVKQHGQKIKKKKVFFKCGVLHNIVKQLYLKKIFFKCYILMKCNTTRQYKGTHC